MLFLRLAPLRVCLAGRLAALPQRFQLLTKPGQIRLLLAREGTELLALARAGPRCFGRCPRVRRRWLAQAAELLGQLSLDGRQAASLDFQVPVDSHSLRLQGAGQGGDVHVSRGGDGVGR